MSNRWLMVFPDLFPPWFQSWICPAKGQPARAVQTPDGTIVHLMPMDGVSSRSCLRIEPDTRLAYWCDKKLAINTGADFTVLAKLYEANGGLVTHLDLMKSLKPSLYAHSNARLTWARREEKEAVYNIQCALEKAGCTEDILKSVYRQGYYLHFPDEKSR
jgi:hypothetical protein